VLQFQHALHISSLDDYHFVHLVRPYLHRRDVPLLMCLTPHYLIKDFC
jgi:hypothetical protein